MHRKILIVLAAAGLGVSVAACASTVPGQGAASAQAAAAGMSTAAAASAAVESAAERRSSSPAASLRLLTEPGSGIGPIYKLITGARHSVDLTMYELADPAAEADLAADAARGVDVRVLLDRHLEKARNTSAYNYLSAHRVHVRWAPAGTTYHQKTLTVDGATSVVMTLNLVASDYPGTRDFAVIDTGRADVAAIVATFNADFAGQAITPPDGADLVWSPTNARALVLSVIDGAKHTLAVEDEEMDDPAVTAALAAAARRGVHVSITMTADSEWDPAFTELARAGAHIRLYRDDSSALYIHAKAIVADAGRSGQRVLVGSQNFSVASLGYNRELGILTSDTQIVAAIAATLAAGLRRRLALLPAARVHIRRQVHGHRERLRRLPRREQRLRALQPARPGGHRDRGRLLPQLPDRQFWLRADLPQRLPTWRQDHRDRRRSHLHHQRLTDPTERPT